MAIKNLNGNKAPGPDGFTMALYQECWEVVKNDLMGVFQEFFRSGVVNRSTNATFIALIPKKLKAEKVSDFRPISLVTSLYKIIAKVLSGRLKEVLQETVHSVQGAFVRDRQILDGILVANEAVDEMRRKRSGGVVFKIDFQKAYDCVNWSFLDFVLERKGFGQRWRDWMRGCVSSVSFAVLVNGCAKGWVKAGRGLRQGDPLSPFLFNLVADVLSRLVMRAVEVGVLSGFEVGRSRTRVSVLQFADDTIFFARAEQRELLTLKLLLFVFEKCSGLSVSLRKSTISGLNVDQDQLQVLARLVDCKVVGWPIMYLGLPLGGNPNSGRFWDPVLERVSRRLDGWKRALLSLGGRLTLVRSCLAHIPTYYLSLFRVPKRIAKKLERLQRDFLWSGVGEKKRDHLVRWDQVCSPIEEGGLGLGSIVLRNKALLGKWLWRFPVERNSFWHKIIVSLYGYNPNGWDANMSIRWTYRCPWKAIAQGFNLFILHTRWRVGNGARVKFWEDIWWGDVPLSSVYPSLYRLVLSKDAHIIDVLGSSLPLSWRLGFRRNLRDSELGPLHILKSTLSNVVVDPSSTDHRIWSPSPSGDFSVRTFSSVLSHPTTSRIAFPVHFVWKSRAPLKVKIFAWLVASYRVNTNDLLQRRRPHKALSPDICLLCMRSGESVDHVFLHCSFTFRLWQRLFSEAGVAWVCPRQILEVFSISFQGLGPSKKGKELWHLAQMALIWGVWKERNARIFEDKSRGEEAVWDQIRFTTSFWAACGPTFRGTPLSLIQQNWRSSCYT